MHQVPQVPTLPSPLPPPPTKPLKKKNKQKTGIYSNVKILESEKGVGSGGEQEEIQSLKVSDMN